METVDDGGQAFPRRADWLKGMTLRDYFAAKALGKAIENFLLEDNNRNVVDSDFDLSIDASQIAAFAYEIADAMIARREQN